MRRARIAFIVAAGAALLASKALAFDPATEAQNFSKTEERNYVVLTPEFQKIRTM